MFWISSNISFPIIHSFPPYCLCQEADTNLSKEQEGGYSMRQRCHFSGLNFKVDLKSHGNTVGLKARLFREKKGFLKTPKARVFTHIKEIKAEGSGVIVSWIIEKGRMQIWQKGSVCPTGRRMATWRLGERIEKQGKKRQAGVRLWVCWFSPPHPLISSPGVREDGNTQVIWRTLRTSGLVPHFSGCRPKNLHIFQRSRWVSLTLHPTWHPSHGVEMAVGGVSVGWVGHNVWSSMRCGRGPELPVCHRGTWEVAGVLGHHRGKRQSDQSFRVDFTSQGANGFLMQASGNQEPQVRPRQPGRASNLAGNLYLCHKTWRCGSFPCNQLPSWNAEEEGKSL